MTSTEAKKPVTIRLAKLEDTQGISALLEASTPFVDYRRTVLAQLLQHIKGQGTYVFVAKQKGRNGRIVGVATTTTQSIQEPPAFNLNKVCVHPDYRGGELSDKLIEMRIKHAWKSNRAKVILVDINKPQAIPKYEKFGFKFQKGFRMFEYRGTLERPRRKS